MHNLMTFINLEFENAEYGYCNPHCTITLANLDSNADGVCIFAHMAAGLIFW